MNYLTGELENLKKELKELELEQEKQETLLKEALEKESKLTGTEQSLKDRLNNMTKSSSNQVAHCKMHNNPVTTKRW